MNAILILLFPVIFLLAFSLPVAICYFIGLSYGYEFGTEQMGLMIEKGCILGFILAVFPVSFYFIEIAPIFFRGYR
jgi:hypothetical protein